jgi:hypothetical protein
VYVDFLNKNEETNHLLELHHHDIWKINSVTLPILHGRLPPMLSVCKARITDYIQGSMIKLLTYWLQTIFRQKSSGVLV